jgi:hypothetical protein
MSSCEKGETTLSALYNTVVCKNGFPFGLSFNLSVTGMFGIINQDMVKLFETLAMRTANDI